MTERLPVLNESSDLDLVICYNPFDPSDLQREKLIYVPGKPLSDYLEGLPEGTQWTIGIQSRTLTLEEAKEYYPRPGERLSLVLVPTGGDDGKQILRLVAIIAVTIISAGVAAGTIGSLTGWTAVAASTAISVGGTLLINALLPPPTPEVPQYDRNTSETSQTYGIDGPKNTAQEGLPVPVVYGTHRVGGNIVDLYTKNVGDDQYLYIRTLLNDGQVESISDIELNDQPLENFEDVEVRARLGTGNEGVNDWFLNAIRPINVGVELTDSNYLYTTTTEVDRVRLDLVAPRGLVSIDDEGDENEVSVDVIFEYRAAGSADPWTALPVITWGPTVNSTTTSVNAEGIRVHVNPSYGAQSGDFFPYNVKVEYREVGSGTWLTLGEKSGSQRARRAVFVDVYDPNDPDQFIEFSKHLTKGQYEIRITGGSLLRFEEYGTGATGGQVTMRGDSTKTLRASYESTTLPRGEYELRVRRALPASEDSRVMDDVYLTDVNEIDIDNVHYNNRATLSLMIKLGASIRQLPKVTALVEGSLVNTYDDDGTILTTAHSSNPAWVTLDMLTNAERGGGMTSDRIDWETFVEWAEHCVDEGLNFNAVFDYNSNVWDAMQVALRVGHAQIVRKGTKWGVAIDRAFTSATVFDSSNIIADTLEVSWLPLEDRANEVQLSFFDENDGYRKRTIRLTDDTVLSSGRDPRVASLTQIGVTDPAQATREAELILRRNKLIRKTINFDAPISSITVGIGDVAYIETQTARYAEGSSGRLASGSTTTAINLDRPVEFVGGQTYNVLLHYPALKRYDCTITSVLSDRVIVTGLPSGTLLNVNRLKNNGADVHIKSVQDGGASDVIFVEDTSNLATGACELWSTDVVEERAVDVTAGAGEYTSLTLTGAALPEAPPEHTSFIFGRTEKVKEPYRLLSYSHGDHYRRTLSWVQYHGDVYLPSSVSVPAPEVIGAVQTPHVRDVTAFARQVPLGDTLRARLSISWNIADPTNYDGADVYVRYPNKGWRHIGSVFDATEIERDFELGDLIDIRVVAIGRNFRRADFQSAPVESIEVNLSPEFRPVSAPTLPSLASIEYDNLARARVEWTAPASGAVGQYRVDYREIDQATYDAVQGGATPTGEESGYIRGGTYRNTSTVLSELPVGYYQARIRNEVGQSYSDWVVLTFEVPAPAISANVTGLKIAGGAGGAATGTFTGRAAEFEWDDVAAEDDVSGTLPGQIDYWRDYEVRVLTTGDVLIRTEYTRDPKYTYSYEKNIEDSAGSGTLARRSFKVQVRMRGRDGQVSNPSTITASNPAPSVPTVTTVASPYEVSVSFNNPTDADYRGVKVWASTSSGFTMNASTLVWDGAGQPRFPVSPGTTVYYRIGAYDEFDTSPSSVSAELSIVVPQINGGDLGDGTVQINQLAQSIQDEINRVIELGKATIAPGVNAGANGDLRFHKNETTSGANDGEIRVSNIADDGGDGWFNHPTLGKIVVDTPRDILTPWEGSAVPERYRFYILWSQTAVESRFASVSPTAGNFITVTYDELNEQWTAWGDSAGAGQVFTPVATDIVLAIGEKEAASGGIEAVRSLVGNETPVVQRVSSLEASVGTSDGNGTLFSRIVNQETVTGGHASRLSTLETGVGTSDGGGTLFSRIVNQETVTDDHATRITATEQTTDNLTSRTGVIEESLWDGAESRARVMFLAGSGGALAAGWLVSSANPNGEEMSEVGFQADVFKVYNPNLNSGAGGFQETFSVSADKIALNANVEVDGSLLVTGSLYGSELNAASDITIGSGSRIIRLSGNPNSTHSMWIGNSDPSLAGMSVSPDGDIFAKSLTLASQDGYALIDPTGYASDLLRTQILLGSGYRVRTLQTQLPDDTTTYAVTMEAETDLAVEGRFKIGGAVKSGGASFPATVQMKLYYRYNGGAWTQIGSTKTWTKTTDQATYDANPDDYFLVTLWEAPIEANPDIEVIAPGVELRYSQAQNNLPDGEYEYKVEIVNAASFPSQQRGLALTDTSGSGFYVEDNGATVGSGGSPGGYLSLVDTPVSYGQQKRKVPRVSDDELRMEFSTLSSLSRFINVQDYGVRSSNTAAQNVTALRALITAIGSPGNDLYVEVTSKALIYFPPGTYQFNERIDFPNSCFVIGAGQGSTFISWTGTSTTGFRVKPVNVLGNHVSACFQHFTMYWNSHAPDGIGIDIYWPDDQDGVPNANAINYTARSKAYVSCVTMHGNGTGNYASVGVRMRNVSSFRIEDFMYEGTNSQPTYGSPAYFNGTGIIIETQTVADVVTAGQSIEPVVSHASISDCDTGILIQGYCEGIYVMHSNVVRARYGLKAVAAPASTQPSLVMHHNHFNCVYRDVFIDGYSQYYLHGNSFSYWNQGAAEDDNFNNEEFIAVEVVRGVLGEEGSILGNHFLAETPGIPDGKIITLLYVDGQYTQIDSNVFISQPVLPTGCHIHGIHLGPNATQSIVGSGNLFAKFGQSRNRDVVSADYIPISAVTGSFQVGETVNYSGGGSAKVARVRDGNLWIMDPTRNPGSGETVTGVTSSASATTGTRGVVDVRNYRARFEIRAKDQYAGIGGELTFYPDTKNGYNDYWHLGVLGNEFRLFDAAGANRLLWGRNSSLRLLDSNANVRFQLNDLGHLDLLTPDGLHGLRINADNLNVEMLSGTAGFNANATNIYNVGFVSMDQNAGSAAAPAIRGGNVGAASTAGMYWAEAYTKLGLAVAGTAGIEIGGGFVKVLNQPLQLGAYSTVGGRLEWNLETSGNFAAYVDGTIWHLATPSGELGITVTQDNNVALYNNGNLKFTTDSSGVTVTGRVAISGGSTQLYADTVQLGADIFASRIGTAQGALWSGGTQRVIWNGSGGTLTGNWAATGLLQVGTTASQYSAQLSARGANAGNAFEWGHGNTAGYGSTLGYQSGNGKPFIAFNAGHGTVTANTYRTLGLKGSVIRSDLNGGFEFCSVDTASGDNQNANVRVSISNAGAVYGQDFHAYRGDGTGVIYLGDGSHYLYFDGGSYFFGGPLYASEGDIQAEKTTGAPAVGAASIQAGGYAPPLLYMNRVGAASAPTPDNSLMGEIRWAGLTTTSAYTVPAMIQVNTGANTATGMPSNMIFYTHNGTSSVQVMQIDSLGNFGVGVWPLSDTRMTVRSLNNGSSTYGFRVENSDGSPKLLVRDDGPQVNIWSNRLDVIRGTKAEVRATSGSHYSRMLAYDSGYAYFLGSGYTVLRSETSNIEVTSVSGTVSLKAGSNYNLEVNSAQLIGRNSGNEIFRTLADAFQLTNTSGFGGKLRFRSHSGGLGYDIYGQNGANDLVFQNVQSSITNMLFTASGETWLYGGNALRLKAAADASYHYGSFNIYASGYGQLLVQDTEHDHNTVGGGLVIWPSTGVDYRVEVAYAAGRGVRFWMDGDKWRFMSNGEMYGANGGMMRSIDTWLRINDFTPHASGVYFGSSKLRTDSTRVLSYNDQLYLDVADGTSWRITNSTGTIDIGTLSTVHAHFFTSSDRFYFDKPVDAVTGFTVYNTATALTNGQLQLSTGETLRASGDTVIAQAGGVDIAIFDLANGLVLNNLTGPGLGGRILYQNDGAAGGYFATYADGDTWYLTTPAFEFAIAIANNGNVNLYRDGVLKFNTSAGGITVQGTVTEVSDKAVKSGIKDIVRGIEVLRALRPREYENLLTGKFEQGFIAQEVYKVASWLVHKPEVEGEYWGLNYKGLIAPLVEATVEIDDRVRKLEEERDDLVARLERAEQMIADLVSRMDA